MKDITVVLKDSPGTLADLCEVLADAGINIEGISAITYKGECPIHILVKDNLVARKVLETNWMDIIEEKNALVKSIADRPGALEEITRKLADAGLNIEVAYFTTQGKVALVVENFDEANSLLS